MRLVRPPFAIRKLYSSLIWRVPTAEKKIYLTFDDGPTPEVTSWVLNILKQYNAKATFFCVGKNVETYPELYKQILNEGHAVGNHTYNHLNGWKTRKEEYFQSIEKCSKLVSSTLFRPPYGKITRTQFLKLKSQYSIIMWDILSYDYDNTMKPEKCFTNVMRFAREGSIIVFHDSLKAQKNLQFILPKVIEQLRLKGYNFEV